MTDKTPAMPELPEPDYVHEDGHDEYGYATYGRAYTADQMRAYALAALQSAQPAEVSDAEIDAARQLPQCWDGPGFAARFNHRAFARAILARRPQAVPMTDEQIVAIAATPCAIPGSYVYSFARAVEAFHHIGITQRADGGEKQA